MLSEHPGHEPLNTYLRRRYRNVDRCALLIRHPHLEGRRLIGKVFRHFEPFHDLKRLNDTPTCFSSVVIRVSASSRALLLSVS